MCLAVAVQNGPKRPMALGIYQKDPISLAALRSRNRVEADASRSVRHNHGYSVTSLYIRSCLNQLVGYQSAGRDRFSRDLSDRLRQFSDTRRKREQLA